MNYKTITPGVTGGNIYNKCFCKCWDAVVISPDINIFYIFF